MQYTYNWDNSYKNSEIKQIWNSINNSWVKGVKAEYFYTKGQLALEKRYKWSSAKKTWKLSDRILYSRELPALSANKKAIYNNKEQLYEASA